MTQRLLAVLILVTVGAVRQAGAHSAIPGTSFALGMRVTRVDSLAAFEPNGRQSGQERRRGFTRFFGLRAEAQLDFVAGMLMQARLSVPDVSTHSRDYVEDQLRRLGLRPGCGRFDDAAHDCIWTGPARLRVTWTPGSLSAEAGSPADVARADAVPDENIAALAALVRRAAAGQGSARADSGRASDAGAMAGIGRATPAGDTPPAAIASGGDTAVFLPDTLVLGARRTSRAQFIAQPLEPPVQPAYPPAAERAGVQGVVRVLATVDSLGRVSDAAILRGIPELDESALMVARQCRFVPLWWSGHRVGYRVIIPVTFTRR